MDPLLDEIQALETELHHPGARGDVARLEQLLHPQFHEVGRSGRAYDRATVIRYLAAQSGPAAVVSSGFALARLADDIALLTYRSAWRREDGSFDLPTHRSSIWVRVGGTWRVRYHQGTPAHEDDATDAPGK
jgi:hypothetical protein